MNQVDRLFWAIALWLDLRKIQKNRLIPFPAYVSMLDHGTNLDEYINRARWRQIGRAVPIKLMDWRDERNPY